MKCSKKSEFISVEICIKTNHDCDKWVRWFEQKDTYVQKHKRDDYKWYVFFDLPGEKNANDTILSFCKLISELPEEIKQQWLEAGHREFYVGYHIGEEPNSFEEHFDLKTISAVSKLGAGIGIVMYPAEMTDENRIPLDVDQKEAEQD